MTNDLLEAVEKRRTYYEIGCGSPLPDEKIVELIEKAVTHVPSSFNSQSQRVAVLLGDDHKKLWSIVTETLRRIVPPEKFGRTASKIDGFAAGHGTVLYFDDAQVTQDFAAKFPLYKDNFPVWAEHGSAMLQFAIWTMLEAAGFGVNIQHYNPLIDEEVKRTFKLPDSWRLIAQMPFGDIKAGPGVKTFVPLEERMRVFR